MELSLMNALSFVIVVILLMTYRPRRKNGTPTLTCPDCQQALPPLREPTSGRQMLWGGWTCGHCGAELDRLARKIER